MSFKEKITSFLFGSKRDEQTDEAFLTEQEQTHQEAPEAMEATTWFRIC